MTSPDRSIGASGGWAGGPRPTRGPRWLAWLLGIAGGIVGLLLLGLLALQHAPTATLLTNAVLARLPTPPGASMRVYEVRGDWLTRLELRGFRMARGDMTLIAADTLNARYRLASLLGGRLDVEDVDLRGVIVTADTAHAAGANPARATKPPTTLADLLRGRFYHGPPIRIERVTVRDARYGRLAGAADSTLRLTSIEMRARRVSLGGGFSFHVDSLAMRAFPAGDAGSATDLSLAATLEDGRFEVRDLELRSAASDLEARGYVAVDARDSLAEASIALRARPLALSDLDVITPG